MKYDDIVLLEAKQPERRWDKNYKGTEIHWGHRKAITENLYKRYDLSEYEIPEDVVDDIVGGAIEAADRITAHHHGVFGVHDIIDAIGIYLHSDISAILDWAQDDFITALGILDRRCGKRRLEKYAEWEYTRFPSWLKQIYRIRFEAEGIKYHKNYLTD